MLIEASPANRELADALETVELFQGAIRTERLKRAIAARSAILNTWMLQSIRLAALLEACDPRGFEFVLFDKLQRATASRFLLTIKQGLPTGRAFSWDERKVEFTARGHLLYQKPFSLNFQQMPEVAGFLVFLLNSIGLESSDVSFRELLSPALKTADEDGVADQIAYQLRRRLDQWITARQQSEHFTKQFHAMRSYILDLANSRANFTISMTPAGQIEQVTIARGKIVEGPVAVSDFHRKRWPRAYSQLQKHAQLSKKKDATENATAPFMYSIDNTRSWSSIFKARSGLNEGFVRRMNEEGENFSLGLFKFDIAGEAVDFNDVVKVEYSADNGKTWRDQFEPLSEINSFLARRVDVSDDTRAAVQFSVLMKSAKPSELWSGSESEGRALRDFIDNHAIIQFWSELALDDLSANSDLGFKLYRSVARSFVRLYFALQASELERSFREPSSVTSTDGSGDLDIHDISQDKHFDAPVKTTRVVTEEKEWRSPLLDLLSPPCDQIKWLVGTDLELLSECLQNPAGDIQTSYDAYEDDRQANRTTSLFGHYRPLPQFALTLARYIVFGQLQEVVSKSKDRRPLGSIAERDYAQLSLDLREIATKINSISYTLFNHLRGHNPQSALCVLADIEPIVVRELAETVGLSRITLNSFLTDDGLELAPHIQRLLNEQMTQIVETRGKKLGKRVREALRTTQRQGLRQEDIANRECMVALELAVPHISKLSEIVEAISEWINSISRTDAFSHDMTMFEAAFAALYTRPTMA